MTRTLRSIMAVAALSLLGLAALHSGLVIPGPFNEARCTRSSVAVVLVVGIKPTFFGRDGARWGGLASTLLALVGASIGLYMALRRLGPNTVPNIVYHMAVIALLLRRDRRCLASPVETLISRRGPLTGLFLRRDEASHLQLRPVTPSRPRVSQAGDRDAPFRCPGCYPAV